jgi:tetratricopeptide (TPR) repeat protein
MLGAAQVDAGRPKAALRAYTRALNCDGDIWLTSDVPDDTGWRVRAGMAKIHLAANQHGEAADCLVGAVALNPTNAELHALLAHTYEAVGRSGDARRHLESAVMVARAGPDAYLAFGDFFTKKAEEALLRGLVDNAESRPLLERIERLRAARAIA